MRRNDSEAVRVVMEMNLEGKWEKEWSKKRRIYEINCHYSWEKSMWVTKR